MQWRMRRHVHRCCSAAMLRVGGHHGCSCMCLRALQAHWLRVRWRAAPCAAFLRRAAWQRLWCWACCARWRCLVCSHDCKCCAAGARLRCRPLSAKPCDSLRPSCLFCCETLFQTVASFRAGMCPAAFSTCLFSRPSGCCCKLSPAVLPTCLCTQCAGCWFSVFTGCKTHTSG